MLKTTIIYQKKILAGPTLLNVNVTNAVLVWLYQGLFRI